MECFDCPVYRNPFRTRTDVQEAVGQLTGPLKRLYTQGGAFLHTANMGVTYSEESAMLEAFARPLWGLVPLMAGGGESELLGTYINGIRHGTDPLHPEYWGEIQDYDQAMVEMPTIGLALSLIPDKVWAPLTEEERRNLFNWLDQINHHPQWDNNWLLFLVLVNLGLKNVGRPYNRDGMEKAMNRIDDFYLGDGWYSDGLTQQRDYYISFAIHYYTLIYAKLNERDDPHRASVYRDRAKLFAQDFIYWFSNDGSAIPFGRSLTYRFAQTAFWGALAFAGVEAFPWGVIKGIVLRHLRWWFKQPILTSEGILSVGYAYPNIIMSESYNAEGSPYWAFKAFLPLSLDENHPFWKAEELPLPELKPISVQKHPYMVICRNKKQNHVFALTSGQYAGFEPAHNADKYSKFAYSNLFGFSVTKGEYGLAQGAFDSMLALSEGDFYYRGRRKCEEVNIIGQVIYSKWKPWADVEVSTWLVPANPWHIRIHCVKTGRCLEAAEGGFAIEHDRKEFVPSDKGILHENHGIAGRYPWGLSGIVNLLGHREGEMILADPNTNLLKSRTAIPTLKCSLKPGTHWLASAVYADLDDPLCEEIWRKPPQLKMEANLMKIINCEGNQSIFELKP